MLAQLPKLFDREFIIGYFLPALVTLSVLLSLLYTFGTGADIYNSLQGKNFLDVAVGLVLVWLMAVAFMAMNSWIIGCLSGNGRLNPFRLIRLFQLKSFDSLIGDRADLLNKKRALEKADKPVPDEMTVQYAKILRALAIQFPDQQTWVLPTGFGNTLRAHEVYPRVVYGLDTIGSWERLLGVIPNDFQSQIAAKKAQLDFWVNLWFGAIVVAVVYGVLGVACSTWPQPWIPFLGLAFSFAAAKFAKANAREWGGFMMAAFDLYRGDLAAKMGFELPRSVVEERAFWQLFSQAMIYRSPEAMERLTKYRKHRQN